MTAGNIDREVGGFHRLDGVRAPLLDRPVELLGHSIRGEVRADDDSLRLAVVIAALQLRVFQREPGGSQHVTSRLRAIAMSSRTEICLSLEPIIGWGARDRRPQQLADRCHTLAQRSEPCDANRFCRRRR